MGCSDILLESIVDWQPHLLPFWFTMVMAPRPRFPKIAPSQRLSTKQVQQAHFRGHGIYLMITMTQKLSVLLAETFLELWYNLMLFWPISPSFLHPSQWFEGSPAYSSSLTFSCTRVSHKKISWMFPLCWHLLLRRPKPRDTSKQFCKVVLSYQ